jgi:membrane-associated phospholipid phosphatase
MSTRTIAPPRAGADRRRDAPSTPAQGAIFPVLDGGGRGATARAAEVLGPDTPARTFFVGLLIAYVAIAGASILLGLLLTDVVLSWGGIASSDERFVVWLSHHKSSALTDASLIGSIIAGGVVLPIVAGLGALAAAILRQWRLAGFFVFALALEAAVYRSTTFVVHRDRPAVHRLEQLPVSASYYSGHTAAAIAVYCGIALLLTSRIANRGAQVAIWTVAASIPIYVALARMYRGMHHPTDVLGGVVVGIAVLAALVFVCRAAGHANAERARS